MWQTFLNPPSRYQQMPFWFWNGEITEEGITQQLENFRAHEIGGAVIHARMGLSPEVGYLTPRYLQLHRYAVEEAKRLDMWIILYDEGMYPSGSAHGQVVAENQAWAAQGIRETHIDLEGPRQVQWTPEMGRDEHLLCAVLGRSNDEAMDPETLSLLSGGDVPIRCDVQAGSWRIVAAIQTPTGGRIRGVLPGEDDGEPDAPPAADLLNQEAMQAFIRLTHDKLYDAMKEHFGTTLFAVFTDEPSMRGRKPKRGVKSWTPGFEDFFRERKGYDPLPWLPGLWFDLGERGLQLRRDFEDALAQRLEETYYEPLSRWCENHGIALTGHPAGSDDIGPLRHFQIPGQDAVWRWVLPDKNALEGEHSTLGKCSSSAARHLGADRNANELYGAYGFELTMDEMKWLADWLMVRGVNLLVPHAFYYSIEGARAYERPPDVGPHNLWWPYYGRFARYTSRVCWLLSESHHVCSVAVLCEDSRLPWKAAKALFRGQRDFNYLETRYLREAVVEEGLLCVAQQRYEVLIAEEGLQLDQEALEILDDLSEKGIKVLGYGESRLEGVPNLFLCSSPEELLQALDERLPRDITMTPAHEDLRTIHVIKEGRSFYFLTNEGERCIEGTLSLRCDGSPEIWDPLNGTRFQVRARSKKGTVSLPLSLDRRQGLVVAFPGGKMDSAPTWLPENPAESILVLDGFEPKLGNWSSQAGREHYSGRVAYKTTCQLPSEVFRGLSRLWLNLGKVHDIAEVRVDGHTAGVSLWSPHRIEVTDLLGPGPHEVEIIVTNTWSNEMEKKNHPSGLFGPVELMGSKRR